MKVVVVGSGFGKNVMAPAWRSVGCEVEVVSARDADFLSCSMDVGTDLISIHSPPFLHAQHVLLALDRRIPVLCDKPFGLNATDAVAMVERARREDIPTFVNFELRFQPARIKAKQLLDAGSIGDLVHVSLTMFGSGLRRQPYGWLADGAAGGGWMGAYGAHGIDMLRWLTGSEIVRCGGLSRVEVTRRPDADGAMRDCSAEDAFTAWFELRNGVTAGFDTGFSGSVDCPERIVFHGSQGALELIDDTTLILRRSGVAGKHWEFPQAAMDRYAPALSIWLRNVLDAVRTGARAVPDFEDGLAATRALDQLKTSIVRAVGRR